MIEPFLSAASVLKKIEDAGFEAYFVGGSVRDFILQKQIHDVDIASSATPEEIKRIFPKTVDIGIEHGTVLVLYNGNSYEITTFRTESEYEDFRRPKEVVFIRSLEKDLERRDFTINAMAMDVHEQIHDPFGGKESIEAREIRTVGKAEERFHEDALRMMRAVRFVSQLNFEIEAQTRKALTELGYLLEKIAIERKRAEFEKLMSGPSRKKAINIILETNLYAYLPGLENRKVELTKILSYHCDELNTNEMWSLICFSLMKTGKNAEQFLRMWRLPVKQIKEIELILNFLADRLEQEWTKYQIYSAGLHVSLAVERLYHVLNNSDSTEAIESLTNMYWSLLIKQQTDLDIAGSDLLTWFNRKPGPWIKESLFKIESAVLEGLIENDKKQIKEWLLKCNQK
ncbi:CCA tRNA nucleotidyltransferase [Neobacillus sp. PS3-12]|jgi:tRNA nucleotidyltransferase (CCA-adding enzyme)|uniref:CCA tRNA nucleotidyltransferase n=1 Tax=Neobacillus sp. PS3-12 TaxID=3070677 RepID=UPI0027DEC3BE|nr:CCA tRNA nucleotidyltransferase [Neobacillus sp. PS3-12]WML53870.1 CCA tRNA nucleotidyltransferase [Neobacillus sp. PS3-12]